MQPRRCARLALRSRCAAGAACVAAAAHVDNAQVDVLERELRQQEDYIYELEDYLIEYSEKLRQCRIVPVRDRWSGSTVDAEHVEHRRADARRRLAVEPPTLPLNGRQSSRRPPARADVGAASDADRRAAPASRRRRARRRADAAATPRPIDPEEMEAPELEIGPDERSRSGKRRRRHDRRRRRAGDEAPPLHSRSGRLPGRRRAPRRLTSADRGEPTAPLDAEPTAPTQSPQPTRRRADADGADAAAAGRSRRGCRRAAADSPHLRASPLPRTAAPASLLVVVEALNATDEPVDADGEASLMVMARDDAGALQRDRPLGLHRRGDAGRVAVVAAGRRPAPGVAAGRRRAARRASWNCGRGWSTPTARSC